MVAGNGQVAPRTIKVGGSQDGKWVVLSGLQPGEQAIPGSADSIVADCAMALIPAG